MNEPLPGQVFPEDLPKLVLVRGRMPLGVPEMFRHEVLNATYDILICRLWEKQGELMFVHTEWLWEKQGMFTMRG